MLPILEEVVGRYRSMGRRTRKKGSKILANESLEADFKEPETQNPPVSTGFASEDAQCPLCL